MAALSENRGVRQRPDEGFRRWFVNDYFDLIVWYEHRDGPMVGFQLCYSRGIDERAFTWNRGTRSSHYVSAGGDERAHWLATAVLHGDAGPVPQHVVDRLREERGDVEDTLLGVIEREIGDYNARADASQGAPSPKDAPGARRRPGPFGLR